MSEVGSKFNANPQLGLAYGHGGRVLGYVSSLRNCAEHGVTVVFQINSDAGVGDDS